MGIINLFSGSNFIVLPCGVMHEIGNNATILLAELCKEYEYYEANNELGEDGSFYSVSENLQLRANLSYSQQKEAIQVLKDRGLISTCRKGQPPKTYFILNEQAIADITLKSSNLENFKLRKSLTLKKSNLQLEEIQSSNFKKVETKNNNKEYIIKNNNNIIYSQAADEEAEEKEQTTASKIREIIDYLNMVLGTKYSYKAAKTITCIKARLNEGYDIEDFKTVIDKKSKSWLGNPDMEKYLRPETLFGPKFDGYLNAPQSTIRTQRQSDNDILKRYIMAGADETTKSIFDI